MLDEEVSDKLSLSKKTHLKLRGQMVSIGAFYSVDPSSYTADIFLIYWTKRRNKMKNMQAGVDLFG